jgi:hypothetical protein
MYVFLKLINIVIEGASHLNSGSVWVFSAYFIWWDGEVIGL